MSMQNNSNNHHVNRPNRIALMKIAEEAVAAVVVEAVEAVVVRALVR